jgi:hypothetical protein
LDQDLNTPPSRYGKETSVVETARQKYWKDTAAVLLYKISLRSREKSMRTWSDAVDGYLGNASLMNTFRMTRTESIYNFWKRTAFHSKQLMEKRGLADNVIEHKRRER